MKEDALPKEEGEKRKEKKQAEVFTYLIGHYSVKTILYMSHYYFYSLSSFSLKMINRPFAKLRQHPVIPTYFFGLQQYLKQLFVK